MNMNKPQERIVLLDYVRILACISVFYCHLWGALLSYLALFWQELKSISISSPACFGIHGDGLYKCGIDTLFLLPNDSIEKVIFNLCNIFFGLGYQGVHLFFFLSGFGLALSALIKTKKNRNNSIKWIDFFKKRLIRLYPAYWIVLTIYFLLTFKVYHSFLGGMKYYAQGLIFLNVIPATWFVPIIIQIYILFPILFHFLQKNTIYSFLTKTIIIKVISSFIIIIYSVLIYGKLIGFGSGALAPGGVALTRLFEFSFGMALAKIFFKNNFKISIFEKFKNWNIVTIGLIFELIGLFLSSKYASLTIGNYSYPIGLIFSDIFIGIGAVCLVFKSIFLLQPLFKHFNIDKISLISNGTYQAYLLHAVFIDYFANLFYFLFLALKTVPKIEKFPLILFVFIFVLLLFSGFNLFLGSYLEKWQFSSFQKNR